MHTPNSRNVPGRAGGAKIGTLRFVHGSSRRLDVGQQVHRLELTGLSDVD
jgi:hypothetical protein